MIVESIAEAQAQFSTLIEEVQRGRDIVIKDNGRPVAILRPYVPGAGERLPGVLEGQIKIADNFDELPPDIAEAFGMIPGE